ncbi:polymeric immunoglobulin receptor isoform X2 [Tachysurus fulvidraco]|uniref:polymeric immunoglobulin receptor isoform X2 n=1 Tax=Tachysurus fulvidraco TaxID=1234273 RepID=UPI001FEFF0DB|nr:polymeric immunoglobulin receptor isoform X2 [Tachysurus fulvidraco]
MTRLLFLVALLPQLPGVRCFVNTDKEWTAFEGKSITVPCYYTPEYTMNVKYWCHGSVYDFCSSLARTDKQDNAPSSNERITIADDPTQLMFTVTMRELKETDSGWYWCGVERGGIWSTDSATSVYISVIQGVSVVNSEVSAEEGDSVTVECHYSKKHRQNDKKWCRSGHLRSCSVTNNGTFISESLLINDDQKDTVTVTMKDLEMRDAGWYLCGAGEHQVSVHVLVTPRSSTSMQQAYTHAHVCMLRSAPS